MFATYIKLSSCTVILVVPSRKYFYPHYSGIFIAYFVESFLNAPTWISKYGVQYPFDMNNVKYKMTQFLEPFKGQTMGKIVSGYSREDNIAFPKRLTSSVEPHVNVNSRTKQIISTVIRVAVGRQDDYKEVGVLLAPTDELSGLFIAHIVECFLNAPAWIAEFGLEHNFDMAHFQNRMAWFLESFKGNTKKKVVRHDRESTIKFAMHKQLAIISPHFELSVSWKEFTKMLSGDDNPYEFDTIYFEHLDSPSEENEYWHELSPEKFEAIRAVLKESRGVHVELNCAFPKHQQLIRTVFNSIHKLHIIRYIEYYYDTGYDVTSKEFMLTHTFLDFLLKVTWMPSFRTLCLKPNTNGNLSYEEAFNQLLDSCLASGQLKRYEMYEGCEWKLCQDMRKKQILADGKSVGDYSTDYEILLSCLAD
ncbi:hypothetical protein QR680_015040 [Steinernema hermaphroditum]|uniref:Uncharacterized protein n=1 Tax=Steinernema hermaphroditum TaxID=289476 RepID=A0AA39IDG5_9BILA|nr:hypothetical protein QR680_015040 [Steinernema hermaphroditum]